MQEDVARGHYGRKAGKECRLHSQATSLPLSTENNIKFVKFVKILHISLFCAVAAKYN